MHKTYPELRSNHEIIRSLTEMGIDVFTPSSTLEEELASTFNEFSNFVLHQEKDTCIEILENDDSGCVGELQGGSDAYSIYRVSFPINDDDGDGDGDSNIEYNNNAAVKLLNLFNKHTGSSRKSALTLEKIKRYMLIMCARRSRERNCVSYTSLGNLMFIMQFGGPTYGQVRHIDNMIPNVQICLYMSDCCPSTIVYEMDDGDGQPVTDGNSLIVFWERTKDINIPQLIKKILQTNGDVKLKSKWYTKYFSHWNTLNSQLSCFGKLYQPVLYQLGIRETEPGTTLLAGGNEIHAGPPTTTDLGRMFAFAIGIPEEKEEEEETDSIDNEEETEEHENDGEVQYSPVLLHIDFCCLLFRILDYEYSNGDNVAEVQDAKHYLAEILIELIVDYPMKAYLLQIDEERSGIRSWLEHVLERIENKQSINALVEDAVTSEVILYSPDVIIKRRKKKKSKKHRLKESLLT